MVRRPHPIADLGKCGQYVISNLDRHYLNVARSRWRVLVEHVTAVAVSVNDQIALCLEVAVGSSIVCIAVYSPITKKL